MKTKVKTIDIQAKEWFDRTYGNSYFSALITINFGMKSQKTIVLPFQYGYGEHYITVSQAELEKQGILPANDGLSLFHVCKDLGIILRHNKQENCKKREMYK